MDLFAEYEDDAWPTREQVRDLPPSLTGVGLDQPLAVVLEAAAAMGRQALRETMIRFCNTRPGEGEHLCGCTAMDVERDLHAGVDRRRVDAHVTAENIAVERLYAAWALEHRGPAMPFNGIPVGRYITRFSEYDF